jgi:hypothetical protein
MIGKTPRPEIKSIVLYGSHARGDADGDSDLDVCVFTHEHAIVSEAQLATIFPISIGHHMSLTSYCETDLTVMLDYGSLFLWHLKIEGQIVYGKEYLASQLAKLKPFDRHYSEIAYYSEIFVDLIAADSELYAANEFDLSLLFTIVRNTCMILAHKVGVPAFGRQACYHAAARILHDLPLDEVTYLRLSQWKAVYERGADVNGALPSTEEMQNLLAQVQRLLEYADAHTC